MAKNTNLYYTDGGRAAGKNIDIVTGGATHTLITTGPDGSVIKQLNFLYPGGSSDVYWAQNKIVTVEITNGVDTHTIYAESGTGSGAPIPSGTVKAILSLLNLEYLKLDAGWDIQVVVPSSPGGGAGSVLFVTVVLEDY